MERLNCIISEVMGVPPEEIRDDLGPNDIPKWDSLTQIVLISAIESTYRVTLDIEEIFRIMTIGDIRQILREKLQKKAGTSA